MLLSTEDPAKQWLEAEEPAPRGDPRVEVPLSGPAAQLCAMHSALGVAATSVSRAPAGDIQGAAVRALTALAAALPAIASGGIARKDDAHVHNSAAVGLLSQDVSKAESPGTESTAALPAELRNVAVQSDVHGDVYSSVRGEMYRYADNSWRRLPTDAQIAEGAPGAKASLRIDAGALQARLAPQAPKADAILIDGDDTDGTNKSPIADEFIHPRLQSVRSPPGLFFHNDPEMLAAADASAAARTAAHLTAAAVASAAGQYVTAPCADGTRHPSAISKAVAPPPEAWGAAAAAAAVHVAAAAVDAAAVNAVSDAEMVRRRWRLDPAAAAARIAATLSNAEASGEPGEPTPTPLHGRTGGVLRSIASGLDGVGDGFPSRGGLPTPVLQGLVSDLEYVQSPEYAMEMVRASLLRKSGAGQNPAHPPLCGRVRGPTAASATCGNWTSGAQDPHGSRKQPSADTMELLGATVPPGVGPGDCVRVVTPAGRSVEVPVPPGVCPGDVFHFVAQGETGSEPPGNGQYDTSSTTARRFATAGAAAAAAAQEYLSNARDSIRRDAIFGATATGWTQRGERDSLRSSRPVWGVGPGGRSRPRAPGRSARGVSMLSSTSLLGLWGGPAKADAVAHRYQPKADRANGRTSCTRATNDGLGEHGDDTVRRSRVLVGGAATMHEESVGFGKDVERGPNVEACMASIEAERKSLLTEMRRVRDSLRAPRSLCESSGACMQSGSTFNNAANQQPSQQRAHYGNSPAPAQRKLATPSRPASSLPSSHVWPAQRASERRFLALLQSCFQKLDPMGRGCVPLARLIRLLEGAGAQDAASTSDARAWSSKIRSLCLKLEARLHAARAQGESRDMEFLIFWEDTLALAAPDDLPSEQGLARLDDGQAAGRAGEMNLPSSYEPPSTISEATARFVAANAPHMPQRGARLECTGAGPPSSLISAAAAERVAAATGLRVLDTARTAQHEVPSTHGHGIPHMVVPLEADAGPSGVAIPTGVTIPGNILALDRAQHTPQGVPKVIPAVASTQEPHEPPQRGAERDRVGTTSNCGQTILLSADAAPSSACAPSVHASDPNSRTSRWRTGEHAGDDAASQAKSEAVGRVASFDPSTRDPRARATQGREDDGPANATTTHFTTASAPPPSGLAAVRGTGMDTLDGATAQAISAAIDEASSCALSSHTVRSTTPSQHLPKSAPTQDSAAAASSIPISDQPALLEDGSAEVAESGSRELAPGSTEAPLGLALPSHPPRTALSNRGVERSTPAPASSPFGISVAAFAATTAEVGNAPPSTAPAPAAACVVARVTAPVAAIGTEFSSTPIEPPALEPRRSRSLLDTGCLGQAIGVSGSVTPYGGSEWEDSPHGGRGSRAASPAPGAGSSCSIADPDGGTSSSATRTSTLSNSALRQTKVDITSSSATPLAMAPAVRAVMLKPVVTLSSTSVACKSTKAIVQAQASATVACPTPVSASPIPVRSAAVAKATAVVAKPVTVTTAGVVRAVASRPAAAAATAVRVVKKDAPDKQSQ